MKKTVISNDLTYFSYFNHKLYDNPIYLQDDKSYSSVQTVEEDLPTYSHYSATKLDNEDKLIPLNLLDLSPTKKNFIIQNSTSKSNNSLKSQNEKQLYKSPIKEIKPELQKYILPKSLFNSNKSKKNDEEKKDKTNDFVINNSSSLSNKTNLVNQINIYSEPFTPKYKVYPFLLINNPSYSFYYYELNPPIKNYNSHNKNKENTHNEKKKKKKNKEFVEREGDWPCYRCKNLNFSFRNKCNKCKMPKEESDKKFIEVGEELLKLADLSIYNKIKDK